MKAFCIPALTLAAIAALGATVSRADTQYTYAGNPFTNFFQSQTTAPLYSCSSDIGECGISVEMMFSTALPDNMSLETVTPSSLIILDGTNILVEGLPGVDLFQGVGMADGIRLATDAAGNIDEWDVTVRKLTQDGAFQDAEFMDTINLPGSGATPEDDTSLTLVTGGGAASNQNDPGVWTTHSTVVPPPVNTPEPGSLALAAPALLALAGMAFKKFRN
jgi:hypothetical protein